MNNATLMFRLTAHEGEPYLLVHEISTALQGDAHGAFEFSLQDFYGGRGFLHWTAEGRNIHWHTLASEQAQTIARLQEQTPWWIPPQGFAHAMGADGLEQQDYIGVFTLRRGEWVDRAFEQIASGPGDDGRELDWPFPEMVGSTISMITSELTHDDAFYRFGCFDGERQWGLLISTFDQNDGPMKIMQQVQHKNSSPRLDDFLHWRLDEQDRYARPCAFVQREQLPAIRKKIHKPAFAAAWQAIKNNQGNGPNLAMRCLVENNPALAWQLKQELVVVAHVRCRMALLGREYSDMYSPVGARPLTSWVQTYDLIAATGVFTEDEERLVRRFFMLMGHMHKTRDFMNWNFNARNANFEADRVEVVGSIGLAFRGNADADAFIQHGLNLFERALNVYCTPGSGKWYENPACYYLQAMTCWLGFAIHCARLELDDPTRVDRLEDFLNWGVLLLTPPMLNDDRFLAGQALPELVETTKPVRLIAPIGDHAEFGKPLPEHIAVMAKLYRQRNPAFAERLRGAYLASSKIGKAHGNPAMLLTCLDEQDLEPTSSIQLSSRRLEGFGAVLRHHVHTDREFFLLWKQGPGGYRYHRTEGSFILFAHGQPLVFDGGEAGETWRHATLSFHDSHMPLAPGHVQRFSTLPGIDFIQGVHPTVIAPGEPVFLSDDCNHRLVEQAYKRLGEPNPADVRSLINVHDQYLIVRDELNLPPSVRSYWNLPVLADSEQGNATKGYRFRGRFNIDLQVQLPECEVSQETIRKFEIIRHPGINGPRIPVYMRALQVHCPATQHYTAMLRPLRRHDQPYHASLLRHDGNIVGIRVQAEDIDDLLFISQRVIKTEVCGVTFEGTYGGMLRHGNSHQLFLLDYGSIAFNNTNLHSHGSPCSREISHNK